MNEGETMEITISHKDFKELEEMQPGRIVLCDSESSFCYTVYDSCGWIPCSERLPEFGDLCQIVTNTWKEGHRYYSQANPVAYCRIQANGKGLWIPQAQWFSYYDEEVVAWKPWSLKYEEVEG